MQNIKVSKFHTNKKQAKNLISIPGPKTAFSR